MATATMQISPVELGVPEVVANVSVATNNAVADALLAAMKRFDEANPISKQLHETAANVLPGGNTRTLLYNNPFPLSMKRGEGAFLWDEDGHKYTDIMGEMSAGLYGHSNPIIRETVMSTLDQVGISLGGTIKQEQVYGQLLCEKFGMERLRFANTGTEASLHALNAARKFTGRRKVIAFSGGYHGAVISFRNGKVASNIVDADDWVLGRYNDVDATRALIETTPDLAAVIVEGMQGAGGCIPGTRDFLHTAQESAKKAGAVFILDEVMTSRLAPGGLQSKLSLRPDLTTLGKYLGGGFSFGAFGGRADIMAIYDARLAGSLVHNGTFNNNTMTMFAGFAGLSRVYTDDVNVAFNAKGDRLRERLQEVSKGSKMSFSGLGTLMQVHISDAGLREISRVEDMQEREDLKDLFWFEMLEEGFWLHRRGYAALVLDMPEGEYDRLVACVGRFLQRHREIM